MKKTDANVFYYNSFQNKTASDRPRAGHWTEETVSYFTFLLYEGGLTYDQKRLMKLTATALALTLAADLHVAPDLLEQHHLSSTDQ